MAVSEVHLLKSSVDGRELPLRRLLIIGLNYTPEQIGIGPYTAEMAAYLAQAGYEVQAIVAKPYYPQWQVAEGYRGLGYQRSWESGVRITRCPLYVPSRPTGARRILHYASFLLTAFVPAVLSAFRRRPDMVMVVAPSLMSALLARAIARLRGSACWLHIQDFEVGAALATGLINPNSRLARSAVKFERTVMTGFDRYSSISPQMCKRLVAMGFPGDRVVEFRNWSDTAAITPMQVPSSFRAQWNITTPHVVLYSGNIANKQDIGIITDAARILRSRSDITFVVCGNGPQWQHLVALGADLPNIQFHGLQPRDRLGDLVNLATIHLLPQLGEAADLVLPSKLTNMLASGRPIVATAHMGTSLAEEVRQCGIVVPPGDRLAFAQAILTLADDPELHALCSRNARHRAEEVWSKERVLGRVKQEIERLIDERAASAAKSRQFKNAPEVFRGRT